MTRRIDLNADMGEGYGRWSIGDDAALLQHITSANIACGLHAGDADVMAKTMALALEKGVNLGAHPGFPDLQGFGRRRMTLPEASLRNMIRYQLGAADAMARAAGGRLRHFKLHGALSNMASEDAALARACYETALDFDPDLVILILPLTAMQEAMEALGGIWAGEIFADRAYNEDATLVDRSQAGAMIHDGAEAAANMAAMVREQAIICASGKRLPCRVDTICVHGDTPESLEIAANVRARLEAEGNAVCAL
ncbi:5-oxoprolinase subunit PxpA [Tropicimonas sp. TH_r6]|uniref:LamB/YcsF family protein n=1 Tax=Tropicimonas sp. TH_r6 TaxID=3082085 RepID=UPI002953FDBE|nr:5-oxoprolinase subunit PxpA [Tropicimonas sp. TH_r6]MDV7144095.1 5-oxoprolinase subunit PxpA [Tropicimonas sp. TH_r6]